MPHDLRPPVGPQRSRLPFRVAAGAALLLLALAAWTTLFGGIRVRLLNDGPGTLRAVVVHVTGRTYPLGNLPAGARASLLVEPTGESRLEIEVADDAGGTRRLVVDVYFEPGYSEIFDVELDAGRIRAVRHRSGLRTVY